MDVLNTETFAGSYRRAQVLGLENILKHNRDVPRPHSQHLFDVFSFVTGNVPGRVIEYTSFVRAKHID